MRNLNTLTIAAIAMVVSVSAWASLLVPRFWEFSGHLEL